MQADAAGPGNAPSPLAPQQGRRHSRQRRVGTWRMSSSFAPWRRLRRACRDRTGRGGVDRPPQGGAWISLEKASAHGRADEDCFSSASSTPLRLLTAVRRGGVRCSHDQSAKWSVLASPSHQSAMIAPRAWAPMLLLPVARRELRRDHECRGAAGVEGGIKGRRT